MNEDAPKNPKHGDLWKDRVSDRTWQWCANSNKWIDPRSWRESVGVAS